jgi:hypothetical protein
MNIIKLKIIVAIILCFLSSSIFAQNRTVTNRRALQTLELLKELSGGASVWEGQAGITAMNRINVALARATDLKTSSQVIVYRSAQLIIDGKTEREFYELVGGRESGLTFTGTYVDTMQYLELGISPDLMVSILKEVMDIGNASERSSWFMSMLNVTASEAASLTQITVNKADYINSHIIVRPRVERRTTEAAEAAARKEREETEATARREREASEATARRERESTEETARREREVAEATARRERNEGSLLLGYIYNPNFPIGLQLGFIGKRWGSNASLALGLDLFDSKFRDLPKTNVTYGYSLLDKLESHRIMNIDFSFGIYYRIINNIFIDAGLGFYFYNTYGLYNVTGKSEPVWHEIVGDDGSGLVTGFSLKAGLMYTYRWFFLTAGYKHFFDTYNSTPSFYAGGGVSIFFK